MLGWSGRLGIKWFILGLWEKQWKSRRSCLEKFALGRSQGKSDFPEGRSRKGMSDYPRDLPWANFQTIPKALPLLVRLPASKNKGNVSRRSGLNIFRVSRWVVWQCHTVFLYIEIPLDLILDGVGPVDNRPSTDKLHHFVQKRKEKWHATCDMWHVTRDMWHVTCDTWHMKCDTFGGVNILSKFQLPSSYCLWFMILWRSGGKGSLNQWVTRQTFSKWFFFARSEFSLIKFCAELCMKIAIKTCNIWKNIVKLCQKYEKLPVLQVPRSKV